MKPARAAAGLLLGALALPAAAATEYTYTAETLGPAKKQGVVKAGGISWRCQGPRCTVTGPWARPGVGACKALAQQVGEIRAYGHPGSQLGAAELRQCNAGVAASTQSPPARDANAPARDANAAARNREQKDQQRSEQSKSTEPFRPQKIRTAALRVTGTGRTAALGAGFAPMKIRTARLTVTGTGGTAAIGAAFEPRSVRTAPLTITGTGTP